MSLDVEGGPAPAAPGWALHRELKRQSDQIAELHIANSALVIRARAAERRALPLQGAALQSLRGVLAEARNAIADGRDDAAIDLIDQVLNHAPTERPEIEELAYFFRRP